MALTKLEIRLEAETTRLQKDLERANRKMKRFAGRASKASKAASAAFKKIGFAGGVAAAGIALLVKNSLAAGDALAKTADKLGTTTEKLAGLQHAAEITGVAQQTLNKALTKQQKALFDADRGLLTYSQHFETLGLSTKELMKLDPVDQFKAIAEAMKGVTNQTKKTAIAYDLFGGRGTALLNTLELGAEGLDAMAKEADVLGIALSRIEAAKIEEANDTFVRMKGVVKGVGNAITISLAPILDALGKKFVETAKESGGMVNFIGSGMTKIAEAVGFVADIFNGLKVVWKGLVVVFKAFAVSIIGLIRGINQPFLLLFKALAPFSAEAEKAFLTLSSFGKSAYDSLAKSQEEFNAALMAPVPTASLKKWVDQVQFAAQKVAEAKAKAVADTQAQAGAPEADDSKLKAALDKKVDLIEKSLMSERRREIESHEARQFILEEAFQNEQISWEKRSRLLEGIEAKHKKNMAALDSEAGQKRMNVAKGILGNLSGLMNSASKRDFEIGKKAAKAIAIVKGIEAVQSSYAAGAEVGGPWVGAAFAATAALATKANIDAINSTSFSGGGSISRASTGGNVSDLTNIPSQQDQQIDQNNTGQATFIIIGGGAESDSDLDNLMDRISERLNEGSQVMIRRDSVQAQEILSAVNQ